MNGQSMNRQIESTFTAHLPGRRVLLVRVDEREINAEKLMRRRKGEKEANEDWKRRLRGLLNSSRPNESFETR